jgi:hypothetical protein
MGVFYFSDSHFINFKENLGSGENLKCSEVSSSTHKSGVTSISLVRVLFCLQCIIFKSWWKYFMSMGSVTS